MANLFFFSLEGGNQLECQEKNAPVQYLRVIVSFHRDIFLSCFSKYRGWFISQETVPRSLIMSTLILGNNPPPYAFLLSVFRGNNGLYPLNWWSLGILYIPPAISALQSPLRSWCLQHEFLFSFFRIQLNLHPIHPSWPSRWRSSSSSLWDTWMSEYCY